MVTVPPMIPASVRLPAVSLKRTLPAPLLAAKDVTVLASVSRAMAEPFPLTEKAPAMIAPDWSTAPAAPMVTVPPVISPSVRLPSESVKKTSPLELLAAKDVTVLASVSSVIAAP